MKFKSALVTQVSGSIGGMTGSHNRSGMYFRARSIPTNPGSAYQTTVRSALAQVAQFWNDVLTETQREAWRTYAENVSVLNRLGDAVFLTGQQHYIRSNVSRIQAGLPRVDAGPTAMNVGSFTPVGVLPTAGSPGSLSVFFTDADEWANEDDSALLLYAAREQQPGVVFFKGPYRYAGKIAGNSAVPPTSPYVGDAPWDYTAGNKAFSRVICSRADGRLSASQFGVTVIT